MSIDYGFRSKEGYDYMDGSYGNPRFTDEGLWDIFPREKWYKDITYTMKELKEMVLKLKEGTELRMRFEQIQEMLLEFNKETVRFFLT